MSSSDPALKKLPLSPPTDGERRGDAASARGGAEDGHRVAVPAREGGGRSATHARVARGPLATWREEPGCVDTGEPNRERVRAVQGAGAPRDADHARPAAAQGRGVLAEKEPPPFSRPRTGGRCRARGRKVGEARTRRGPSERVISSPDPSEDPGHRPRHTHDGAARDAWRGVTGVPGGKRGLFKAAARTSRSRALPAPYVRRPPSLALAPARGGARTGPRRALDVSPGSRDADAPVRGSAVRVRRARA